MKWPRILWFLACFWLLPQLASAAEALTVSYFERPPYYYTTDSGTPAGFLLERTGAIFREVGIEVNFISLTPYRIIYILRHVTTPHCSVGWFKNEERELFAKFSEPIYRDQPLVVLTSKGQGQQFASLRTLREVFFSRHLTLARMGEFSYGNYVDELLGELVPKSAFFTGKQTNLLQAVAAKQAAYMLVAPEEIEMLVESMGATVDNFVSFKLQDMPAGNLRYLMCNQEVDDQFLWQVNEAIKKLYPGLASGDPLP